MTETFKEIKYICEDCDCTIQVTEDEITKFGIPECINCGKRMTKEEYEK